MKQKTIFIAIIALFVGGIGVYSFTSDEYGMGGMMHDNNRENEKGHDAMLMDDGTTMNGMDHSMMAVASERDFLVGMIPHHQEAVDTAKEVIARGGSTQEIKKLAENIVVAQEKEIAEMKQWYLDWYGVAYQAKAEDYRPMMRDLTGLSGADLDKRFLEDMIVHHMGAIVMAQSVQPHIEHQEIRTLSSAIIETQMIEIELMKLLISELQ